MFESKIVLSVLKNRNRDHKKNRGNMSTTEMDFTFSKVGLFWKFPIQWGHRRHNVAIWERACFLGKLMGQVLGGICLTELTYVIWNSCKLSPISHLVLSNVLQTNHMHQILPNFTQILPTGSITTRQVLYDQCLLVTAAAAYPVIVTLQSLFYMNTCM